MNSFNKRKLTDEGYNSNNGTPAKKAKSNGSVNGKKGGSEGSSSEESESDEEMKEQPKKAPVTNGKAVNGKKKDDDSSSSGKHFMFILALQMYVHFAMVFQLI